MRYVNTTTVVCVMYLLCVHTLEWKMDGYDYKV